MLRTHRGVITVCICCVALANVQCGRDSRGTQTESRTLTIHMADQDERVLGPRGVWAPASAPIVRNASTAATFESVMSVLFLD